MLFKKFLTFFGIYHKQNLNKLLNDVSGVIHIGANVGQERELYNRHNLEVIWIEPIPEIYRNLKTNIAQLNKQEAFLALITDEDNREYKFNVANNNGQSSSIFELKNHKTVWPEVEFKKYIKIKSITLTTLCEKEKIDLSKYQTLIIDTQGSELLVLIGSIPILHYFKFIKIEVADFDAYEGCYQISDVNDFMVKHGYKEYDRRIFASREEVGSYFDIVYKRVN